MKLTKRKGFNFFRSYYDVYNELNDKDKLAFIGALLDRQFLGIEPKNLKGMAKFAWISQVNSIDAQVKGYNDKAKSLNIPPLLGLDTHTEGVSKGGAKGVQNPPTQQEKEKVEEKGKGKGKEQDVISGVHPLQKFIQENCPNVSRIKTQLTESNCNKLFEDFTKEQIKTVLMELENYKDAPKKYTSVNLTIRNWIKKRVDSQPAGKTYKKL